MLVYLCGGINGLSDSDCIDWRAEAKAKLITTTLDPMRRDYRGKEAESVIEIVNGDLEDIASCDALLVNATRPSWGTAMEIVYAHKGGKPIFAFTGSGKVSPWLAFHCKLFLSAAEAIAAINEEFRSACAPDA